jgi:hypothetical protein
MRLMRLTRLMGLFVGLLYWVALLGLIIGFDYCYSRPARRVLLIP